MKGEPKMVFKAAESSEGGGGFSVKMGERGVEVRKKVPRRRKNVELPADAPTPPSTLKKRAELAAKLPVPRSEQKPHLVLDDNPIEEMEEAGIYPDDMQDLAPDTIWAALVESKSVKELDAHLTQLGLADSRRHEVTELFRQRQQHEADVLPDDSFMAFPEGTLDLIRRAVEKSGSRRAILDAHDQFGLTAAQMRHAFYVLDERALKLSTDQLAFGAMLDRTKAFMKVNGTAGLDAVAHGTHIPEKTLSAVYDALEREGFLARTRSGRWVIQKQGSDVGSAYLTREKMPTDPELQEPAKLIPEIKQVLSSTHAAYPEYLRWRFGLSDVQATYVLRTLRDDGFLREEEDGELRIYPEDGSGTSYPVVFPEGASPTRPLALPHFPPHEERTDVFETIQSAESEALPRRQRGGRALLAEEASVFGDDRPLVRQRIKPTNPPTIHPTKLPGEDPDYEEPEVRVSIPLLPKKPARDKEGNLIEPRPPLKRLDPQTLKFLPPTPDEVKKVQEALYGVDVDIRSHDLGPIVHELSDEDVVSEEPEEEGEAQEEGPAESGVRERMSVDKVAMKAELATLEHQLAFAPGGETYQRHLLEQRIALLKQVIERSELEDERDLVRQRIVRFGEELGVLRTQIEDAQKRFEAAEKALSDAQDEERAAWESFRAIPGGVPTLPADRAAREEQLLKWQKAASGLPLGSAERKTAENLAAGLELILSADANVTRAKEGLRTVRKERDDLVTKRDGLLKEYEEIKERDLALSEKISGLDALLGVALAGGGLAAFALERPEDVEAVQEAFKQAEAEKHAFEKAQDDKRKANEEAAEASAKKKEKVVSALNKGGLTVTGAFGLVMGAFWLAGKAVEGLFYLLRHPVKSFQFFWNKAVKLVQEGGGGGKTPKPPKGASPNPA